MMICLFSVIHDDTQTENKHEHFKTIIHIKIFSRESKDTDKNTLRFNCIKVIYV